MTLNLVNKQQTIILYAINFSIYKALVLQFGKEFSLMKSDDVANV